MVPTAFSPPWSVLVGWPRSIFFFFFFCFSPCQNSRSSEAGLVVSRPRGGCGHGFSVLCSLAPGFLYRQVFFFFLPCSIPSDWSQGPRPGGGWAPGFVACPPRSLGPFMVMRSTSCSFEGRFSCLWGHFWDMSPSLTFRSPLWSVNCSLYLVSFF